MKEICKLGRLKKFIHCVTKMRIVMVILVGVLVSIHVNASDRKETFYIKNGIECGIQSNSGYKVTNREKTGRVELATSTATTLFGDSDKEMLFVTFYDSNGDEIKGYGFDKEKSGYKDVSSDTANSETRYKNMHLLGGYSENATLSLSISLLSIAESSENFICLSFNCKKKDNTTEIIVAYLPFTQTDFDKLVKMIKDFGGL